MADHCAPPTAPHAALADPFAASAALHAMAETVGLDGTT
jgi:hypothetical protein